MHLIVCLVALSAFPDKPIQELGFGGTDFVQYYVVWELIKQGKNPYDPQLNGPPQLQLGATKVLPVYSPPWSFLSTLPLGSLSFSEAVQGQLVVNLCLLAFITICWNSLLHSVRWSYVPFIFFGVFFWTGTLLLLGHGQISLWPMVGFTGWLWCCARQRYFPAGLFLVLTIIKPHTGLLPGLFAGVYSLRQKNWSTMRAFILGLFLATGTMLWFRPTIFADYLQGIQSVTSPSEYHTATLDGWMRLYVSESFGYLSWLLWGTALIFTVVVAWFGFKADISRTHIDPPPPDQPAPLVIWSVLACMATVVFVPYAYPHDFVFMLPGFFLTTGFWLKDHPSGRIAIASWILLYVVFMLLHFARLRVPSFWFISWVGLGKTIWLLRDRLHFDKKHLPLAPFS